MMLGPAPARGDPAGSAGGSAWFEAIQNRIDAGLEITFETALETRSARAQKAELKLEPDLEVALFGGLSMTGIASLRIDAFDRIEPGRPSQPEISGITRRRSLGNHIDFDLRELYIEGALGNVLFTVGKQQIVWGKADGLKVLDVVNPQNFREFILDDFEDSRIPLWSVNAEILLGEVTAQIVWLPDPTYHDIPSADSLYAFTSPLIIPPAPPGVRVRVEDIDRPSNYFTDSDAGVRLSAFLEGWDLTLNYLYHYDDFPIPFRRRDVTGQGPGVVVTPRYRRTHLVGGTFSNAFGNLTVRGELGFSSSRFFSTLDRTDANGVKRTGELRYVLGLDWFGFEDTLLSLQLFQTWRTLHDSDFVVDELATRLSFFARRTFWNDTLRAETIVLVDANERDGLVRAKVIYDARDDLKVWVGVDFFFGRHDGVFGQFDSRDRFVFGAQLNL